VRRWLFLRRSSELTDPVGHTFAECPFELLRSRWEKVSGYLNVANFIINLAFCRWYSYQCDQVKNIAHPAADTVAESSSSSSALRFVVACGLDFRLWVCQKQFHIGIIALRPSTLQSLPLVAANRLYAPDHQAVRIYRSTLRWSYKPNGLKLNVNIP